MGHSLDDPKALFAERARNQGLKCTRNPSLYKRLLDNRDLQNKTEAERTQWAQDVLGFVFASLLAPVEDVVCLPTFWQPGSKDPVLYDTTVRLDGFVGVAGRKPIPAYLFLPKVKHDEPFAPRGAVVLIHGHDSGRIELIDNPNGYQKAMGLKLAQAGFIVLVADNISWGTNDPDGDGIGKHAKDFKTYYGQFQPNGLLTRNLQDVFHQVTLLQGLYVAPDAGLQRWNVANPDAPDATQAVRAIGISGLSYGAQVASYMVLDPRPTSYVIASGLIDTCDVLQNDHHECQTIPSFEGVVTIWDTLIAAAMLDRPRFGLGSGRPWILVEQGERDKIYKNWGQQGLTEIQLQATDLDLTQLTVHKSKRDGHTYMVSETLKFFQNTLRGSAEIRE
ncbi:MAG: hypothetical protein HUU55_06660 [Myxococcales bacterium]|nr:hypothetical protein [Myxococcales bacterium]